MSAALSISVDESAGTMLRMFAAYPIHHLPVVSGRRVVGMVSSADIMKFDAFRLRAGVPSNEHLTRVSVADLMSKPAVTIRSHQSLIDAAHMMASNGVHALPVVDADEQLLGILTTTDIIAATLEALGYGPVPRVAAPGCHEDAA